MHYVLQVELIRLKKQRNIYAFTVYAGEKLFLNVIKIAL